MEMNFLSNCCDAFMVQADQQGHGKCTQCGDNCTPEIEKEEPVYILPDLSWQVVFLIASAMFIIDGLCNMYWSFH